MRFASTAIAASVRVLTKGRFGPGHDGHAGAHGRLSRGGLAAHDRHRLGARPDERQAAVGARLREVLVLRQKPVARVDQRRARPFGDVNDLVDAEITLGRRTRTEVMRFVGEPHVQRIAIAVGVHGDGTEPHLAAGADHADGDLAAIGDQDFHEKRRDTE